MMFIQICQNASDKIGICCRLRDLSEEDGERFMLSVQGGGSAEVCRDKDDPSMSGTAEFFDLVPGVVYTINALRFTEMGWKFFGHCTAVASSAGAFRGGNSGKRPVKRVMAAEPPPPTGILPGDRTLRITCTVESVEAI